MLPTRQEYGATPASLQHAPEPALITGIWCAKCYTRRGGQSQWTHRLYRDRLLLLVVAVLAATLSNNAFAAAFTKASECVVGTRVVNRDNQAGVIVSADGSSCRVKLDSTGKIDYNIFWMLSPEGSGGGATPPGTAAAKGSGKSAAGNTEGLPAGIYKCYMLVGSTLNYAFIDIHITGTNRYRDKSGKAGTYTVGAADKITFTGPLASANAKLLPGLRIGLNMNGGNFYNTSCSMVR